MKKLFLSIFALSTTMLLAGCGSTSSSMSVSSETSNTSSVSAASSLTSEAAPISSLREAEVNTTHTIKGIVVKHVYTGQSTPYITGMMVADETGCIYVYGEETAKSCEIGNEIVVKGTKAYYIPKTDAGSAETVHYKGQLQLTSPEIISNDKGTHDIPSGIIHSIQSLNEVMNTPLTTDITGNLYRIKGRIHSVTSTGRDEYTNYYLYDLNRTDSLAFYTQSNGKDYTWLDEYKDKAVDITFAIINAKPGTGLWRGLPIHIHEEVTVTSQQEADYAAERALKQIGDEYTLAMNNTLPTTDERLEGVQIAYQSSDSTVIAFTEENNITVTIPDTRKEVEITAIAKYQGTTGTKKKTVAVYKETADYKVTSIADARKAEVDTELYVEGIVARRTYKSGTNSPLGCFLADATGSIVIYQGSDYLDNISEIQEGNKLIVKGKISHYKSGGMKDENYGGDIQLMNVEVVSNDRGNNPLPTECIEEKTLTEIIDTPSDINISGMIYKVNAKIVKSTQSYRLADPANLDKTLLLYSQKSGSDFSWLDERADEESVTMYVGVQNANYSKSQFLWRGCPIAFAE